MTGKLHAEHLLHVMLPKRSLVAGEYYVGKCRNATIARWDGALFHHRRLKYGQVFVETIHHPDDEAVFDCFVPVAHAGDFEVRPIEFEVL